MSDFIDLHAISLRLINNRILFHCIQHAVRRFLFFFYFLECALVFYSYFSSSRRKWTRTIFSWSSSVCRCVDHTNIGIINRFLKQAKKGHTKSWKMDKIPMKIAPTQHIKTIKQNKIVSPKRFPIRVNSDSITCKRMRGSTLYKTQHNINSFTSNWLYTHHK